MFATSGPVFLERQVPLETDGFKRDLVFRKSGNKKRVDFRSRAFYWLAFAPESWCVGRSVGSQFAQRARSDEAAMAVGVAWWLAAAGERAARTGSRPGMCSGLCVGKMKGRKRPTL